MNTNIQALIENLNHPQKDVRLESLKDLMQAIEAGEYPRPVSGRDVNNHIHTTYSFSPYSPTKAVWMAYTSGLSTAGIMDHDSISGAEEFIEAGLIAGIATTIGIEFRTDLSWTVLNGKKFNNPDQASISYLTLHGVPHTQIGTVREFFKPYTEFRNQRNEKMVERINALSAPVGIVLDFAKDIVPISNYPVGGSITERHVLYAYALKLIEKYGKGRLLLDALKDKLSLKVSTKIEDWLLDESNPHYGYDLLGLLKSEMVSSFYVDAKEECPDVREVLALSAKIGAIAAYPYLGDVGDSVTGDKKTQKFEDDFLVELFDLLKELGFHAVTYMPSRNTEVQLERLRMLCEQYGFFQISGEDINSSRQSFICMAQRNEKYQNLYDATWALIGHEAIATIKLSAGMFSQETLKKFPSLEERTRVFRDIGFVLAAQ